MGLINFVIIHFILRVKKTIANIAHFDRGKERVSVELFGVAMSFLLRNKSFHF